MVIAKKTRWVAYIGLGFALCTNALASAEKSSVTDCRKLLNYVLLDPSKRILPIYDDQVVNLDPDRLTTFQSQMVWNQPGTQHAAGVAKQFHAVLDHIVEQSLANSSQPKFLTEYPEYKKGIEALKNYITLWTQAFSDPDTGFLNFNPITNASVQARFKALELEAAKEVIIASEYLNITSGYSFIKMNPILHFSFPGLRMNWITQVIPSRNDKGFHFVVHSLKSNELFRDKWHNEIFALKLRDFIFGETGKLVSPAHKYRFVSGTEEKRYSVLDFFDALNKLNESGVSHIDLDAAARKLIIEINLQTMKYFCQVTKLCEKLNLGFIHEIERIDSPLAHRLLLSPGGYYPYSQYENEFDVLFRHLIATNFSKNRYSNYKFMNWEDFKEYAKTFVKDYNEEQWDKSIELYLQNGGHSQQNSVINFGPQDNMLAENVKADWLNISYTSDARWHAQELSLADVSIDELTMQIKPAAQSYQHHQLLDVHLKLIIGRIQDLLKATPPREKP